MLTATGENQINVLILDSNRGLSEAIADSFARSGGLFVSCTAREGTHAIELLDLHKPDVLLLDIVLPLRDGFSVLEDIQESEVMKNGTIIVSTSMGSDLAMRRSIELGADYFMLKPFDIDILIKRIQEIHAEKKAIENSYLSEDSTMAGLRKVDGAIKEFMFKSGISSNLKGYDYLHKAIHLCLYDEEALYGLTKIVYPKIGKEFGSDGVNVERAMRHAIQTSWKKGRVQSFFEEIGYKDVEYKKPTTGSFIKIAIRTIKGERSFKY